MYGVGASLAIQWLRLHTSIKGVNTPVKFGERTRDCSPGQAGKEGPHLSLTGASCGFSRTAALLGPKGRRERS